MPFGNSQFCVKIADEKNPDSRFLGECETGNDTSLLSIHADARSGLHAGDLTQFFRNFWEVTSSRSTWEAVQTAVNDTSTFSGREQIIRWENEQGALAALAESVKHLNHAAQNWRAREAVLGETRRNCRPYGKCRMQHLLRRDQYDVNSSAIIPKSEKELTALWCFCESGQFSESVRRLDIHSSWRHKLC